MLVDDPKCQALVESWPCFRAQSLAGSDLAGTCVRSDFATALGASVKWSSSNKAIHRVVREIGRESRRGKV